jgi:hypothetical protein
MPAGMRGTVLLLDSASSPPVDIELLRAHGLTVRHCRQLADALEQSLNPVPDVVVVLSPRDSSSIEALRGSVDYATSIIVASHPERREESRRAGADCFLPEYIPPADLIYEIHRALILRRSGRRLPWS